MKSTRITVFAVGLLGIALSASAQIVRISAGDFTPEASVITFSEFPVNTQNPVYHLNTASLGNVTVSFGPRFFGQSLTAGFPVSLGGSPTGPLSLNLSANPTFITTDISTPTSPVLSGNPTYNGPISMLFSTPVAAVGLTGGFFDAVASTSITAFDSTGGLIGTVTNSKTGIEFFGLSTATGNNTISGISFYITGNEPAGFVIDNFTFGSVAEITHPPGAVPEPSTYGLFGGVALAGIITLRRRLNRFNKR